MARSDRRTKGLVATAIVIAVLLLALGLGIAGRSSGQGTAAVGRVNLGSGQQAAQGAASAGGSDTPSAPSSGTKSGGTSNHGHSGTTPSKGTPTTKPHSSPVSTTVPKAPPTTGWSQINAPTETETAPTTTTTTEGSPCHGDGHHSSCHRGGDSCSSAESNWTGEDEHHDTVHCRQDSDGHWRWTRS